MSIKFKVQDFNSWLNSKEPHRVFHDSDYHYKLHDEPRIGAGIFGGTEYGHSWTTYDYTKLGKFVNKMPIIPELLLKLIYYCITWPLYLCVKIPWVLFCAVFVPSSWV